MNRKLTASRILKASGARNVKPQELSFVLEYVKDFNANRAAHMVNIKPADALKLLDRDDINTVLHAILDYRMEDAIIDADWLLMELVDNHIIARQTGKISASNTALGLIAKHVSVDAFAADKLEMHADKDLVERLMRGRERVAKIDKDDPPPLIDSKPANELSFL